MRPFRRLLTHLLRTATPTLVVHLDPDRRHTPLLSRTDLANTVLTANKTHGIRLSLLMTKQLLCLVLIPGLTQATVAACLLVLQDQDPCTALTREVVDSRDR